MHADHKKFLEERYRAHDWHRKGARKGPIHRGFRFAGAELRGWTLLRAQRDEQADPPVVRSLWRRGQAEDQVLAIDVFECPAVAAAHDQLLAALSNFESSAIERRTGEDAPGDVAFALDNTMILFARHNLVVLVRNAGRSVVSVGTVARAIDRLIERSSEPEDRR